MDDGKLLLFAVHFVQKDYTATHIIDSCQIRSANLHIPLKKANLDSWIDKRG